MLFLPDHLGLYSLHIVSTLQYDEGEGDGWNRAVFGERFDSVESIAVPQFFLILLVWIQDRVFVLLQASLGRPLQVCERVWWQTGTLFNRAGVVPVRL